MKKYLLLSVLCAFLAAPTFAQKAPKLKTKKLSQSFKASSGLTGQVKLLAGKALGYESAESEEEDCTPPPCTGIIDPWTCECFDDIRDPWEEDQIATRMKAVQQFEGALLKGAAKNIISPELVRQTRAKYPGRSLKAIVNRLNVYENSLK
ncbi:MAG: hypothetical protein AAFR61_16885 [Bacteroidota bacterium]